MNIAIFEDITTESALCALEKESETYTGLYVEMDQPEQRKFVKGKAVLITDLLKKLDRARIEKSRDYKILVEAEAKSIKKRLENANKPFTLLIDEYKIVREKQLAEEKAKAEAKALAKQIPIDHDEALLMNKMFNFEKAEAVRQEKAQQELIEERARIHAEEAANKAVKDAEEKAERDRIAFEEREKQAAEKAEADKNAAVKAEQQRQIDEKARLVAEEAAREANIKHRKKINNEALQAFTKGGLPKEIAKLAVELIAKKMIANVIINY